MSLSLEECDGNDPRELHQAALGGSRLRGGYRAELIALRLGVLALRDARGELDVEAIRQEGARLLSQVRETLTANAAGVTTQIADALSRFGTKRGRWWWLIRFAAGISEKRTDNSSCA